jgi:hypothetical protein
VTPTKAGYNFNPPSTSYTNITGSQSKDYVGTLIQNPVPTVVSVVPALGIRGQRLPVTLTGTGFMPGVTSIGFGADITSDSVVITSPTQLTAVLSVGATAAGGARNVTVTNSAPGGGTGTLTGGFTVGYQAPRVTSIVPSGAGRGSLVNVSVVGSQFATGITSLSLGADITVSNLIVKSATELQASIAIGSSAAIGPRNVVVTNASPGGGSVNLTNGFNVTTASPTAVEAEAGLSPDHYVLQEAYPNPFNPTTKIRYGLPENSRVTLDVYNMLGNVVAELMVGERAKGMYELQWYADNLPSGVYLVRLHAESLESVKRFIASRKIVLVK